MSRLTKQYADTKRYYSTHSCDEVLQKLGKLEDKEEAKKFATKQLHDQARFWEGSYTTKKKRDGYCAITLVGQDAIKRYILQEHDVQ